MWKETLGEEISVFGFEGINYFKAQWLSWLERRPVTAEVVGSSPIWVVKFYMKFEKVLLYEEILL